MFDVLHDALQPDTKVYSDPAANDILGLLSEHKPSFMEVDTFNMTCIEIAEELPDDHPSMAKLLITLAFVHSDPKFMEGESDSSLPSTVKWSVLVWTSGLQPQQYYRYQKLKEAYHDELSTLNKDDVRQHVGFHTFAAQIARRSCNPRTGDPTLAIWALRDASEDHRKVKGVARELYVMAVAAQWSLITGGTLYEKVLHPENLAAAGEVENSWPPGPRFRGMLVLWYGGMGELGRRRWRLWRDGFWAVATGRWDKEKRSDFGQECKMLATKAADCMEALERRKGG